MLSRLKLIYIPLICIIILLSCCSHNPYTSISITNSQLEQYRQMIYHKDFIKPEVLNTRNVKGQIRVYIKNNSDETIEFSEIYLVDPRSVQTWYSKTDAEIKCSYLKNQEIQTELDITNNIDCIEYCSIQPGGVEIITYPWNITTHEILFDLDENKITSYDQSSLVYRYYTRKEKNIQTSNSRIQIIAKQVIGNADNSLEKAKSIYHFIKQNIEFRESDKDRDAVYTLNAKHGNSTSISHLFAAMTRYAGIPCRIITGFAPHEDGGFTTQRWNEIYFNEYGWVPVDVACSIKNNRDYFGYMDAFHVAACYGGYSYESHDLDVSFELNYDTPYNTIKSEQHLAQPQLSNKRKTTGMLQRTIYFNDSQKRDKSTVYLPSVEYNADSKQHTNLLGTNKEFKKFKGDVSMLGGNSIKMDPCTLLKIYSFDLQNNTDSITIADQLEFITYDLTFDLNADNVKNYNKNSDLYIFYTREEPLIQKNHDKIIETVQEIIKDQQNPIIKSKLIFDYMIENIDIHPNSSAEDGAVETLNIKQGNQLDISLLFCALNRAAGIPARIITGLIPTNGKFVYHNWNEIYFENYGWVPADVYISKLYRDEFFGNIDNKHISLYYGYNDVLSKDDISIDINFIHTPSQKKITSEYNQMKDKYIQPEILNTKKINAIHTLYIDNVSGQPLKNVEIFNPSLESSDSSYSKITRKQKYNEYELFEGDTELFCYDKMIFDPCTKIEKLKYEKIDENFKKQIVEKLDIQLREIKFCLDKDILTDYDKSSEIYRVYTQPGNLIECNHPKIIELADSIKGELKNPLSICKKIYQYIVDNMEYKTMYQEKGALYALNTKQGDCTEYSTLFVALARAAGIPAREVYGQTLEPDGKLGGGHAWAEVYFNEYGWVPVDPTWGQGLNKDYFGYMDDRHIIFSHQSYLQPYSHQGQMENSLSINFEIELVE